MSMEIRIQRQFSGINENEWDSLLSQSETDVPFLRYGYLKSWWEYKGGGEWPENSRLYLLSGWDGETLIGVAPLFFPACGKENVLYFLGSIEISDYLDFICLPEFKEDFIKQVLFSILNDPQGIEEIILINAPKSSSTIGLIEKFSRGLGWSATTEDAYHTPAIKLAEDWDVYLSGIDKKQRHEIRRKIRRAEENAESIKWIIANDQESLDREIESFFSLMEMDPDKKEFLTPLMRDQMKSIIHWAFGEGILQLSFLRIDGKNAAAYLCFDYGNHLLVYNSGFDYGFSEYSPGWVLLSYLIRHAIANGKTHFDFMRGDETYKYRFGAEDGFVMKTVLTRI